MSLFQCENCGCRENTALSAQGFKPLADCFDWSYAPKLEGKLLCSACGPAKYKSGEPTEYGFWHGEFERTFLPKDQFRTNRTGNLEHIETGETDVQKYALTEEELNQAMIEEAINMAAEILGKPRETLIVFTDTPQTLNCDPP